MGSSGIPREIYIIGLLLFYVVFGLLLAGFGNMYQNYSSNNLPSTEGGYTNNNPLLPESDNLFGFIHRGFSAYPLWLNLIFILFAFALALLIAMLLLHG